MAVEGQQFDDAFTMLTAMLKDWGIDGLNNAAADILRDGYAPEVASLKLQETPEYKQRFKANDDRRKAGLPVLSPAEYVATERQYQSTLREYGLPQGFYDSHDDFNNFLANDVSPQELRDRAQTARAAYIDATPEVKDQWEKLYGLTPGDAVASFLDPNRALDSIKRKAQATSIGAEAWKAYKGDYQIDVGRAEELTNAGVTTEDARRGFSDVASRTDRDQFLGRLGGNEITKTEEENEVLLNDATAKAKRQDIYNAEQGRFQQNYMGTNSASLAKAGGNF